MKRFALPILVLAVLVTGTVAVNRNPELARASGSNAAVLIVARNSAAQTRVVRTLAAKHIGDVQSFHVIDAIAARISPSLRAELEADSGVAEVVPDVPMPKTDANANAETSEAPASAVAPLPGACAAPGKVQLNPEALGILHVDSDDPLAPTARSLGVDGSGVTVATTAEGLDIDNPDFIRANGQHVFVDYKDFSGNGTDAPTGGTEAFLDASSIAAQGRQTYDVSHYSALPLNRACLIRVEGVAPGASLVGMDVFGNDAPAFLGARLLQAIEYAVDSDHVDVINESIGINEYPDDGALLDVIEQANDAAVRAGVTVTVASGDAGPRNTVGVPATDPNVITVGATTSFRPFVQDGFGGGRLPGVTGWSDNNITSFSAGGFQQDGRTVDVVAPGEDGWALCSTDTSRYQDCLSYRGVPTPVQEGGGTSESAPLTAGVAALVIQAFRAAHHGLSPTPAIVKRIITSTADDLGAPADQQGAGLVDAYQAVQAARSYESPATAVGQSILLGTAQVNRIDQPNTAETVHDTVTNNGDGAEDLVQSCRTLGNFQRLSSTTVTLGPSSAHIPDWVGGTDDYSTVRIDVAPGYAQLHAAVTYHGSVVRLTLVDPVGRIAAYTEVFTSANGQDVFGGSGYGEVQVTDPTPGHWTAYLFSRPSSYTATTSGPVLFEASAAKNRSCGTVTPARVHLLPGQSTTITARLRTPAAPGDVADALVLRSSSGRTTAVPVTLRSMIPPGPQRFTTTVGGGNLFAAVGPIYTYQLDLPSRRPNLNASVALADDPGYSFMAWLVAPSGETRAYSENAELSGASVRNRLAVQLHVVDPEAGRWRLLIGFIWTVPGHTLSEPLTISTDQAPVSAVADLPQSNAVTLPRGRPATFTVQVTNPGPVRADYFLDARLPTQTTMPVQAIDGLADAVAPSDIVSFLPQYLVPTHTTRLVAFGRARGGRPIRIESAAPAGDPYIASAPGFSVSASLHATALSQGEWDIDAEALGPSGATALPTETVATSMTITTETFDTAVTSATGDLWRTTSSALKDVHLMSAQPGSTVTIPVTITPTAAPGTRVSGTLYLDDARLVAWLGPTPFLNANEVVAIPYSYTVA